MIIKLDEYFFVESSIKASKKKHADDGENCAVEASGQLFENPADQTQFQIMLTISFKKKPKKAPIRYSGTVIVVGSFSADPSVSREKVESLLMVNGLSMLYASAREHILSITSRGPWPPFCLPTISFNPNAKSIEEKAKK